MSVLIIFSGFINGIDSTHANLAVGIIMIIIGSLFAACAAIAMILLLRVRIKAQAIEISVQGVHMQQ